MEWSLDFKNYDYIKDNENTQRGPLRLTLLSTEWRPHLLNFSIIIRGLAIELAKHPNVEVSVFLPHCSEEERENAAGYSVRLVQAEKMVPATHPIDWLINLPQGHVMDCVIAHGGTNGREVPYIIKKQHNCKWIQVVLEEPESNITNLSESEKWQQTEVEICEMADQILAIGAKLAVAYQHFYSGKMDQNVSAYTPSIFSEICNVEQVKESPDFQVLLLGLSEKFEMKECEIAAEAIAALHNETYKLKFVYSPMVNIEEFKETFFQSCIRQNQLFTHPITDNSITIAELTDLFSKIDLAIMPSQTASFELTALGALSAGLPILVAGSSGFGKALKEVPLGSEYIVSSDNPEDWAWKIRAICEKPRVVRQKQMKLIRENYLEKYNLKESCDKLLRKIHEIVSGKSKSRAKKSRTKSKDLSAKRPSSIFPEFTAKKLKGDPITQPSRSPKETTLHVECLQQREEESMLIEEDVPMKEVLSQLVDVKMVPTVTLRHLELKKDPLLDVKVITRSVIFRGEVTEKGNEWNLPEAAAYVTFHEGAVPKPLLFTCSVWSPKLRCPPMGSDELLVSNVIELSHDGPPDLEFNGDDEGNITVSLLHSASDLKGYEVVIKQLVDPHDSEWKDLETWHASEKADVSDWPQLVEATCTLSRCSSFAAIWRLKSFTFSRHTSVAPQFTCVVPDFPDIRVEVPLSSVPADQDFALTIKVQEFPGNEVEDMRILCGPAIHISSSQNIVHTEPVTIKVPLALRESKHDFSELSTDVVRISHLDSERKPWNASWTDITNQLEGPVIVKDGNVEFKVKHFCRFCPVCVFNERATLLEDFFRRLFFRPMPQCVHFLTCLCKTTVPDTYSLLLYCYPNFKKAELEKKLLSYDVPYKGEGKSKEPACVGDEIVVSPLALDFVRESQRNEKVVLRFLGNDISDNSDMALIVRLDNESVPTVKFSKDEELRKLLCEVPILKTRPASACVVISQVPPTVTVDPRVLPEERPSLIKDGEPDDVELSDIAEKIPQLWKKLGRVLRVPRENLDELGINYRDDAYERAFQVLSCWKENASDGAISRYQLLFDALTKIGRSDLAKKYCCYCPTFDASEGRKG
ncbi:uncharacterized protein LOC111337037 [Stylophora pistillata]|uniref:uncharacterized protein LOC111337037 n=1 Tax=Stylophora pistillata TaxID=50429 RepID=UPI000C055EDC|nr:uncharacterized protein LOC111337037 [Stylophora pistillata]